METQGNASVLLEAYSWFTSYRLLQHTFSKSAATYFTNSFYCCATQLHTIRYSLLF